ncbi:hypothetical protein BH24ACT4_BH24ACT4_17760 [soil metagenome]
MTPRTYRNLPLVAASGILGGVFVVLFVLLAVGDAGASPSGGSATELYLISAVVALVLLRGARLRVRVDDGGVTAYSLVRTHRIPWEELVGAVADAKGLVLLPATGAPVLVQSLGQTALARWLRPRTQGTDVADALNEERERRSG